MQHPTSPVSVLLRCCIHSPACRYLSSNITFVLLYATLKIARSPSQCLSLNSGGRRHQFWDDRNPQHWSSRQLALEVGPTNESFIAAYLWGSSTSIKVYKHVHPAHILLIRAPTISTYTPPQSSQYTNSLGFRHQPARSSSLTMALPVPQPVSPQIGAFPSAACLCMRMWYTP